MRRKIKDAVETLTRPVHAESTWVSNKGRTERQINEQYNEVYDKNADLFVMMVRFDKDYCPLLGCASCKANKIHAFAGIKKYTVALTDANGHKRLVPGDKKNYRCGACGTERAWGTAVVFDDGTFW